MAGPPILPLRILGPFVVLATLALLGSGLMLIWLGEQRSRSSAIPLVGDWVSLHQAIFVVFDVVAGLHLLARIVPALMLVSGWRKESPGAAGPVPGRTARVAVLALTAAVAAGGSPRRWSCRPPPAGRTTTMAGSSDPRACRRTGDGLDLRPLDGRSRAGTGLGVPATPTPA